MLNRDIKEIFEISKQYGWVLEPYAKEILKKFEIKTPEFIFTKNIDKAKIFANKNYPVVAKIVSPDIIHKSDYKGVVVGISNDRELIDAFESLSKLKGFQGVLVEKMVKGIELIIGAKNDLQFGPVVLVGIGGIGVEIYKDSVVRMAPLNENDIDEMLKSLKYFPILKGYRGNKGINLDILKEILLKFSNIVIKIEPFFESIDLNPVMCSESDCFVTDARIMLKNNS